MKYSWIRRKEIDSASGRLLCKYMIVEENINQEYLKISTRGGLTNPSNALSDYMSVTDSQFLMKYIQLLEEMGFLQKMEQVRFLTTCVTFH